LIVRPEAQEQGVHAEEGLTANTFSRHLIPGDGERALTDGSGFKDDGSYLQ